MAASPNKRSLRTMTPLLTRTAPPTNPGAPGYLGSSVSAEFSSLGSAFFCGWDRPWRGLRADYCPGQGRRWNPRQRITLASGNAAAASKRVRASDGDGRGVEHPAPVHARVGERARHDGTSTTAMKMVPRLAATSVQLREP